ncbi:MAG TPA: GC-type dockerin domain-anchored protein, partial [Phycisphaerae bacterium]|nr:GC-type dockerin domain-anchored protein [Phycisphaerae bacterium]
VDDLPSGDGVAGGAAVFYVGSLRGDMRGYGPGEIEPDGEITPWDITGFTQKYLSGNLDADMAGYGPGQAEPDADVNPWDISGFTSRYSAAMAAGTHLELLPTGGEGLAVGAPAPLPLAAGTAETATPLSVARLACPAVQADETVSMLAAAPEIGLLTRTSAEPAGGTAAPPGRPWVPGVQHGRPSGCRATHGWASQPCHTPPADESAALVPTPSDDAPAALLVASDDALASPPAPWSPAVPDTTAGTTLAADGVDLLAVPALEILLGV